MLIFKRSHRTINVQNITKDKNELNICKTEFSKLECKRKKQAE